MKRRAKLSLAATNGTDKRQAAGFGPTTTIPPETKSSKVRAHANEASTQSPGTRQHSAFPSGAYGPDQDKSPKPCLSSQHLPWRFIW